MGGLLGASLRLFGRRAWRWIGRRQDFSRLCGARFTDLARPQGTTGGSPLAQADAEVPPFARSVHGNLTLHTEGGWLCFSLKREV
jgi:hypothetical protein